MWVSLQLYYPVEHIQTEEEYYLSEEELIEHYLVLYKRLLLKAPDGNALLYLYISFQY